MKAASVMTFGGYPVYDPQLLAESDDPRIPAIYKQRANSYLCPAGPAPGRGWVLMKRSHFDLLSMREFHELRFWNPDSSGKKLPTHPNEIILKKAFILRAYAMTTVASATASDTLYLVEFSDIRYLLSRYSCLTKTARYNIRIPLDSSSDLAPSPDGSDVNEFYSTTVNGSDPWTWKELIEDLWGRVFGGSGDTGFDITDHVQAVPTVADADFPARNPENFDFAGYSGWAALHAALEAVHHTTAYDPTTHTFSIVDLRDAQASLTTKISTLTTGGFRVLDYQVIENPSAIFPGGARYRHQPVTELLLDGPDYFARVEVGGGIVGDEWLDISGGSIYTTLNSIIAALYPSAGNHVGGRGFRSLDFQHTGESTPSATDTAQEHFLDLARRAFLCKPRRLGFSLIHTSILPGSEVSAVLWRDYGDGAYTEVFSDPTAFCLGMPGMSVNDRARPVVDAYCGVASAIGDSAAADLNASSQVALFNKIYAERNYPRNHEWMRSPLQYARGNLFTIGTDAYTDDMIEIEASGYPGASINGTAVWMEVRDMITGAPLGTDLPRDAVLVGFYTGGYAGDPDEAAGSGLERAPNVIAVFPRAIQEADPTGDGHTVDTAEPASGKFYGLDATNAGGLWRELDAFTSGGTH